MDSIIRGTNATVQIKIKEDLDFSTTTPNANFIPTGIRFKWRVIY